MSQGGEGRQIVVVDDHRDTAEVIKEILQSEDFTVDAYVSGREALDRLLTHPLPCLLVVDLLMPEMDGMEFVRTARRAGSRVPVVFATASPVHAKVLDHDELVELNVLQVMLKPLDLEAFVNVVEALAKAECPS